VRPGAREAGRTQWRSWSGAWWVPDDLSGPPEPAPLAPRTPTPTLSARLGDVEVFIDGVELRARGAEGARVLLELPRRRGGRAGYDVAVLGGFAYVLAEGPDFSVSLFRTDGETAETVERFEKAEPPVPYHSRLFVHAERLWFSLSNGTFHHLMVTDGRPGAARPFGPLPERAEAIRAFAPLPSGFAALPDVGPLLQRRGDALEAVDLGAPVIALSPRPGGAFAVLEVGRRASRVVAWDGREARPMGVIARALPRARTTVRGVGDAVVVETSRMSWVIPPGGEAVELGRVLDAHERAGGLVLVRAAGGGHDVARIEADGQVEVTVEGLEGPPRLLPTAAGFLLGAPGTPARLRALTPRGRPAGPELSLPTDPGAAWDGDRVGVRPGGAPVFARRRRTFTLDPVTAAVRGDWPGATFLGGTAEGSWLARSRPGGVELWALDPALRRLRGFSGSGLVGLGTVDGDLLVLRVSSTRTVEIWRASATDARRLGQWSALEARYGFVRSDASLHGLLAAPDGPRLVTVSFEGETSTVAITPPEAIRDISRLLPGGDRPWLLTTTRGDGAWVRRLGIIRPSGQVEDVFTLDDPGVASARVAERHVGVGARLLRLDGERVMDAGHRPSAWLEVAGGAFFTATASSGERLGWWWPAGGVPAPVEGMTDPRDWQTLGPRRAVARATTPGRGAELVLVEATAARPLTDLRPGPLRGVEQVLGVIDGRVWVTGVDETLRPGLFAVDPAARPRSGALPDAEGGCQGAPSPASGLPLLVLLLAPRRGRRGA
jgi:hypothetical protein